MKGMVLSVHPKL